MTFDSLKFARTLKSERMKRGWSQKDLADRTGLSLNTITRYEIQDTIPPFDKAVKIADAFGCRVDDLLGANLPN